MLKYMYILNSFSISNEYPTYLTFFPDKSFQRLFYGKRCNISCKHIDLLKSGGRPEFPQPPFSKQQQMYPRKRDSSRLAEIPPILHDWLRSLN